MAWTSDQLDRIGAAQELHITSSRADGTLRKSIPIWVVRVGDDLYIRSAFGPDSGWYRHATANNSAHVQAGGVDTDVALESATDAETNAKVDAAYRSKYRNQPSSLSYMTTPDAAQTTLRLIATAG
jgi:hypothetical protein